MTATLAGCFTELSLMIILIWGPCLIQMFNLPFQGLTEFRKITMPIQQDVRILPYISMVFLACAGCVSSENANEDPSVLSDTVSLVTIKLRFSNNPWSEVAITHERAGEALQIRFTEYFAGSVVKSKLSTSIKTLDFRLFSAHLYSLPKEQAAWIPGHFGTIIVYTNNPLAFREYRDVEPYKCFQQFQNDFPELAEVDRAACMPKHWVTAFFTPAGFGQTRTLP